jgi:hypothetical protein
MIFAKSLFVVPAKAENTSPLEGGGLAGMTRE